MYVGTVEEKTVEVEMEVVLRSRLMSKLGRGLLDKETMAEVKGEVVLA